MPTLNVRTPTNQSSDVSFKPLTHSLYNLTSSSSKVPLAKSRCIWWWQVPSCVALAIVLCEAFKWSLISIGIKWNLVHYGGYVARAYSQKGSIAAATAARAAVWMTSLLASTFILPPPHIQNCHSHRWSRCKFPPVFKRGKSGRTLSLHNISMDWRSQQLHTIHRMTANIVAG